MGRRVDQPQARPDHPEGWQAFEQKRSGVCGGPVGVFAVSWTLPGSATRPEAMDGHGPGETGTGDQREQVQQNPVRTVCVFLAVGPESSLSRVELLS